MTRKHPTFDAQKHAQWLGFIQYLSPDSNPALIRLMAQLRLLAHALSLTSEESLRDSGLSPAQYRLLMGLLFYEHVEGRPALNPSEISRMQGTSRNTISALIRALEDDGYVRRTLDPQDRRKFNIELTDGGRAVVHNHAPRHFSTLEAAFAGLSAADADQLSALFDKIGAGILHAPTSE